MDKAKPRIMKVNGKILHNAYQGNGVYIIAGYPKTTRESNKIEFLSASEIIKNRINKRKK